MSPAFVDTGAWFAFLVPGDPDHAAARGWFDRNRRPLVTTDYVLDELFTLLKVRGESRRAMIAGPSFLDGKVCQIAWVTSDDVRDAWQVFSGYHDKGWSFTDCVSRVVMDRLDITIAVAFDEHFRQFGTVAAVP